MSEEQQKELQALKGAHDQYATTIHLLKTRNPYYFEEFEGIQAQVAFYSALKDQVLQKIHEIEPPKPQEPKKPYLIEAPEAAPAMPGTVESSGHATV